MQLHFHWIALRYFRETVRARSIRKAAEHINIAPSAINRQIIKLEEQLGTPLFERSSKGLKLTAAGELFYRWILKSQGDLDQTIAEINDLRVARRGHVTVACEEGIGKDFLPGVIHAFRQTHKYVDFSVCVHDMQDVVLAVANGKADLGIVFSPVNEPRVKRRSEATVAIGAVMHPAHPLAISNEIKLSDLIGETLIVPDGGFSTRQLFNVQLGGDAEALFARRIETNSFETMTAMIKARIGIGIRSRIGIAGEIRRGDVVFVPFEARAFPRETVALIIKALAFFPSRAPVLRRRWMRRCSRWRSKTVSPDKASRLRPMLKPRFRVLRAHPRMSARFIRPTRHRPYREQAADARRSAPRNHPAD